MKPILLLTRYWSTTTFTKLRPSATHIWWDLRRTSTRRLIFDWVNGVYERPHPGLGVCVWRILTKSGSGEGPFQPSPTILCFPKCVPEFSRFFQCVPELSYRKKSARTAKLLLTSKLFPKESNCIITLPLPATAYKCIVTTYRQNGLPAPVLWAQNSPMEKLETRGKTDPNVFNEFTGTASIRRSRHFF